MKRMSRALALVLALIMLTSLCACGRQPTTSIIYEDEIIYESNAPRDNSDGSTSDGNTSGDTGTNGNNSGSTGGKTEVINNCYTSGTKIAKDKITFKVLARDYTGGQCNFANSDFAKYVEKNLNIKLEWTTCVQSEVSTKLTLAYASSTNPYDLYMGVAPSGHTAYIQQGKLTKLNSYIDKYGTNIKKVFKEYPEAEYICTAEDNGIYMLPFVNDRQNFCDLLYVNKTWLKAAGKSIPQTTDELRDVLAAFKKKYPSKTPLVCTSDAGQDVGPSVFGMFGISTYHNWLYIDDSNKVQFAPIANEYRDGLRYFNGLFSAGLLSFASGESDVKALTDADKVGMVLCDSPDMAFSADKFNANWTMVPVLNANKGGTWSNVKYENTWAEWFIVTKSCKYPEAAVRLCDWLYSTEGTLIASYGSEGNYWTRSGNKVTLHNDKIPSGKTAREYGYTLTPGYCLPKCVGGDYNKLEIVNAKSTPESIMSSSIDTLKANLIEPKAQQKYYFPHLTYLQSESAKLAELGDYNQYVYDMRKQFITGTKSVDSDWDSYVNTVKSSYKMDTRLSVVNTAYKRFCAWEKSR